MRVYTEQNPWQSRTRHEIQWVEGELIISRAFGDDEFMAKGEMTSWLQLRAIDESDP